MREEGDRTWLRWGMKWGGIILLLLMLILPCIYFVLFSMSNSMLDTAHTLLDNPNLANTSDDTVSNQNEEMNSTQTNIEVDDHNQIEAWNLIFDEIHLLHQEIRDYPDSCKDIAMEVWDKDHDQRTENERELVEKCWEDIRNKRIFLIMKHEEIIPAIHELAEQGAPFYPVDLENPGQATGYYILAKNCVPWLSIHAEIMAKQGKSKDAVDDILAALKIAQMLSNEKSIDAWESRCDVFYKLYYSMKKFYKEIDYTCYTPIINLIQEHSHQSSRNQLSEAITGKTTESIAFFDRMRNGDKFDLQMIILKSRSEKAKRLRKLGQEYDPNEFRMADISNFIVMEFATSSLAVPWHNRNEAIYIETMNNFADIAHDPYFESLPATQQLKNNISSYFLQNPVLWDLEDNLEMQAVSEVSQDLIYLGLILECFMIEHGTYPKSLEEIAPQLGKALPIDPYTGKPYRYTVTDDGYRLFTLGILEEEATGSETYQDAFLIWPSE